ncbi:MAG: hypothetical protein ACRYF0_22065 [Janthinobacterium lividum]
MATFVVKERSFEIIHASDVSTRDGLGWELWEHQDNNRTLLIEIFRHDDLKEITFSSFHHLNIPFEAIELLLEDFKGGGKDFIDYESL